MKNTGRKVTSVICAAVMFMMTAGTSSTVVAQTVQETEPNNAISEAVSINCNRQTAQEFLKGNNNNNYVVKGTASQADEDWFKVSIDASKDTYLSMTSDSLSFRIYDVNGNPVTESIHQTDGSNVSRVYDYNNFHSGYYYIQIIGDTINSSYMFMIGNPKYKSATVNRKGESVTLSSSQKTVSREIRFDAGLYPEKSQVYTIMIGGVLSTSASKVDIAFSDSDKKNSTTNAAGWSNISVPLNYNYFLDGKYTFTYSYKSSAKTFTPDYDFYYVYPILP